MEKEACWNVESFRMDPVTFSHFSEIHDIPFVMSLTTVCHRYFFHVQDIVDKHANMSGTSSPRQSFRHHVAKAPLSLVLQTPTCLDLIRPVQITMDTYLLPAATR